MAGNNDRIYSYNPVYRDETGPLQFYSFERIRGPFLYRVIEIVNAGEPALDHQGHIVPQNILNQVLDVALADMAANCPTVESAVAYVTHGAPWMRATYAFGLALGIEMFDFDEGDPEDRFDTFFSLVTWNPVNLCRAPTDDHRAGYPGNQIDTQVADYLRAHQAAQGVDAAWMVALDAVIANTTVDTITNYLNACCATMDGQLTYGIGYYQFPWEYQDVDTVQVELDPEMAGMVTEVLVPSKK